MAGTYKIPYTRDKPAHDLLHNRYMYILHNTENHTLWTYRVNTESLKENWTESLFYLFIFCICNINATLKASFEAAHFSSKLTSALINWSRQDLNTSIPLAIWHCANSTLWWANGFSRKQARVNKSLFLFGHNVSNTSRNYNSCFQWQWWNFVHLFVKKLNYMKPLCDILRELK